MATVKREPLPELSTMEVLNLNVTELRSTLSDHGFDSVGTKPELQSRLLDALTSDRIQMRTNDIKRARDADNADTLKSTLECPVCMETAFPPIFQCKEGHIICDSCKKTLPEPKKCPTCRIALGHIRCRAVEESARNLAVPCPQEGCCETPLYQDLQTHVEKCDYRALTCCPIDSKCQWTGNFTQLRAHCDAKHSKNVKVPSAARGCILDDSYTMRLDTRPQDIEKFPLKHRMTYYKSGPDFVKIQFQNNAERLVHMMYIGPEAERHKYRWKISCASDDLTVHWEGKPMSVHEFDRQRKRSKRFGEAEGSCFRLRVTSFKQMSSMKEGKAALRYNIRVWRVID